VKTLAYTVGNPRAYDPALEEGPVKKCPGGVAFETLEEARAVIDAEPAGHLPPEWFNGLLLPGAVYEIELPGPFHYHTNQLKDRRALTCPAPILRRVEGP
jgi:hypothetical protein